MQLHERLLFARSQLGLTLKQVEERTGIGTSSLSEYERGLREPSFAQLGALAQAYHRPVTFFLDSSPLTALKVLWRHPPASPEREEIEATFLELCRQYRQLEEWSGEVVAATLPSFHAGQDVAVLARRVRDALGLGDRPALTLLPILEDTLGIKIFHLPLAESRNAAAVVSDDYGHAVLLNANDLLSERTFSLAHELYHLLTWGETSASTEQEHAADVFAVQLLLPAEALRAAAARPLHAGHIAAGDLLELARQFGVPTATAHRGLAYLCGREIEGIALPGPEKKLEPPTRPARFCALAVKTYRQGNLALGKLAEYLGMSRQEARRRYFEDMEEPIAALA